MSLSSHAARSRRAQAFVAILGTALLTSSLALAQEAKKAIPAGKARLTFTRVSTILYSGVPTTIKVNGQEVASVWNNSTAAVDIAPGPSAVNASGWSYPGSWTLNLNAKAGQNYNIEIAPRGGSVGTAVMFGAIGGAIEASANPGKNIGLFEMKMKGKK